MQQRPDAEQLLLAIQRFLSRGLAPAIDELADLNAELARRIRVDALSDLAIQRTRAHLLETLGGAISVINPKFDLRRELE